MSAVEMTHERAPLTYHQVPGAGPGSATLDKEELEIGTWPAPHRMHVSKKS
jgi:hypothetical protein